MKATDSEIFVKFEIVQFPKIHIIKNVQGKCTFIVFEQFFRCNITYSEKKLSRDSIDIYPILKQINYEI